MEIVNRAQSRNVSANPKAIISNIECTAKAPNKIKALRPVDSGVDSTGAAAVVATTSDDGDETPFIGEC